MNNALFGIASIASFTGFVILFIRGLWSYGRVVLRKDRKYDAAWVAIGFLALNTMWFMARKWFFGSHRDAISAAEEWYWVSSMFFAVASSIQVGFVFRRYERQE